MATHDLPAICSDLISLAKEAGRIILNARPTMSTTIAKKNTADIVTETDRAIESLIRERLACQYPSFAFIGEETNDADVGLSENATFVVDPIDGTSNFVHGFPEVCVSLAFVIDKVPTVGVVYNPFRDELWSGIKGRGAYVSSCHHDGARNSLPLPLVSAPLRGLGPACIGLEWGSDREGPNFELNLKVFTVLARTAATEGRFVNSLRFTGSAALAMCRVAAGQQDAFWECGLWAWDVAAAWCILIEAGGVVVDGHPGTWNPPVDGRRYLAVRPATEGQREFVQEFWSVIGDHRSTYGPLDR
ncbi:hypothetical protein GE09DRAFT_557867 [Coniochaeta sp. 2T2.1]|nr:hypothetical protein GE09DRAFT_557867 [Coniochaeta sp. 2T2.1]